MPTVHGVEENDVAALLFENGAKIQQAQRLDPEIIGREVVDVRVDEEDRWLIHEVNVENRKAKGNLLNAFSGWK